LSFDPGAELLKFSSAITVLVPWPESNNYKNRCKIKLSESHLSVYSQRYSRDFWFPVRTGSVLILSVILDGFSRIFSSWSRE
jgi:hypothetical protein